MKNETNRLYKLRLKFGKGPSRSRRSILLKLAEKIHFNCDELLVLHDILLFSRAYPDNKETLALSESLLKKITSSIKENEQQLQNSGILNSYRHDSFSFDLLKWLVEEGVPILLDWEDGSLGGEFDEFLQQCIFKTEGDSVLSEESSIKDIVELARGKSSELKWLLDRIEELELSPFVLDRVFGSLNLWVRWKLTKDFHSTTLTRFPKRKIFYQADQLINCDVRTYCKKPLPLPRKLSKSEFHSLHSTARAALAVRGRETDPVIYTSSNGITFFELDRGIDIALFELTSERRLPIESYIGFVAARNQVPIAYGGAWILGYRGEIGINIFDAFRGGESSLLFAELLRVYHQHYGVRTFLVHPSQFGGDNEEALKSGAFWFYYRLGFRPDNKNLCTLALRELEEREMNTSYRSSIRILKRLSKARLVLGLDEGSSRLDSELEVQKIGTLLVRIIGRDFSGDRKKARSEALKRLSAPNSIDNDIFLLSLLISNISSWSKAEIAELINVFQKKVGSSEREYVKAFQKHTRLRKALSDRVA